MVDGNVQFFFFFPGTLDRDFIRQWQRTLLIFNGILVILNAVWVCLDFAEEDQDLTLTIVTCVTAMALIVAGLIKTYLKEFVNLDKI